MMEVCGAQRYLRPIPIDAEFTWEERRSMRRAAGCEGSSRRDRVYDYTLHGFDSLLGVLRKSDPITAARKASLLWGALVDLQEGRAEDSPSLVPTNGSMSTRRAAPSTRHSSEPSTELNGFRIPIAVW